jgi:hypothetical protein
MSSGVQILQLKIAIFRVSFSVCVCENVSLPAFSLDENVCLPAFSLDENVCLPAPRIFIGRKCESSRIFIGRKCVSPRIFIGRKQMCENVCLPAISLDANRKQCFRPLTNCNVAFYREHFSTNDKVAPTKRGKACARMRTPCTHCHWIKGESRANLHYVQTVRPIFKTRYVRLFRIQMELFRRKEESLRTPAHAVHAFSLEERREPCESTLRPNRTSNI